MTLQELYGYAAGQETGPVKVNSEIVGRVQRQGSKLYYRDKQDRLLGYLDMSGDKPVLYGPGGQTIARIGQ